MLNSQHTTGEARQQLSALMDGELDPADWGATCDAWRVDGRLRADWHAWHLIGDTMRSDELAAEPRRDNAFLQGFRERLATEPVVLAPMAVVFTPQSLAAISVPVLVIMAEKDAVLNRKYHGGYVAGNLPRAQVSTVGGAGHFAFMAQPTFPLPSAAGDAAANPPGFDRMAILPALESQVAEFFAVQWR